MQNMYILDIVDTRLYKHTHIPLFMAVYIISNLFITNFLLHQHNIGHPALQNPKNNGPEYNQVNL